MNWKVYQHGENIQEAGLRSRATADVIPPLLAVERLRLSAGMRRENDTSCRPIIVKLGKWCLYMSDQLQR